MLHITTKKSDWAYWGWLFIRLMLGGLFLYSGAIKTGASEQFSHTLIPFTILPENWAQPFAIWLAWTEVGAGLLILLPYLHRVGSSFILFLSLAFIGILTWALTNDIIVSCSCFGDYDKPPSASAMRWVILRDFIIACAAIFSLTFRWKKPCSSLI